MRTLESISPQATDESAHAHGARLFAFIVRTGITATLSDLELARALAASMLAVSDGAVSDSVRTRYHDVRRQIMAVERWRRTERAREGVSVPEVASRPNSQPTPRMGPGAPLQPIVPYRPPGGQTVRPAAPIEIAF